MEGPHKPGYYAHVTGVRPPGEAPGLPGPGEPLRGPIALVGEVVRYGPGQRRLYLVKALLGLLDIELAWRGPERPVPSLETPRGMDEHMRVSSICMAEAQAEAERLNRIDPKARGW